MKKAVCFALVAAGTAIGTWLLGWWSVPVVALLAGLLGCGPGLVATACASAWLSLLLIDAATGNLGRIAGLLAGVRGLPAVALFFVTLALPALLGWSAASLGDATRSIRPTSRRPS